MKILLKRIYLVPFLIFLISCQNSSNPSVEMIIENDKRIIVKVEIADTPVTRQQGLMYRDDLAENTGMLFIMPEEKIQNFWMKDTKIPLDIIFIYSDWKIAGIVENTVPFSKEGISIDSPSRYVLEVNAGFCKKNNIHVGNQVIYHPAQ